VPKGTTQLAAELAAYRLNQTPEKGGLGKEQHFLNAFKLMWPKFKWHKWMDLLIHAWCCEPKTIVLGHTRASKTYGMAYIVYLDYCADPYGTWTSITTVTFSSLKDRMWRDLQAAIETAVVPCPFKVIDNSNELNVTLDEDQKKDKKFQINGFATNNNKNAAEKLQGVILDEAEGLAGTGVFEAEVNYMSAPDAKSFKLANPLDRLSEFGQQYEPEGGWGAISDTELTWRSKKGYWVIHFDGLQSYNVELQNSVSPEEYEKKKYPFLIRPEYIEDIRQNYGEDSVEWWKFVRGFPPAEGTVSRAFPAIVLDRMSRDIEFDLPPRKIAMMDPAFEHDDCVVQLAEYGNLRNRKVGLQYLRSLKLQTTVGGKSEPKDYQIARQVIKLCKKEGIAPEDFIMDKTGNGRGVFAVIQMEWFKDPKKPHDDCPRANINGVEFGGSPTTRPIRSDSEDLPKDIYGYFVDELWFRLKAWGEDGLVGGLDNLHGNTRQDLGARIYTLGGVKQHGGKMRLLSKADMKKQIGRSPDYGDAAVLATELMARKGIYVGTQIMVEKPTMQFMYDDPGKRMAHKRTQERVNKFAALHSDDAEGIFTHGDE